MAQPSSGLSIVSEFGQLRELIQRLGAPQAQAETIALQLIKRAEQLAVERNLSREAAMEHLLRVVVHGRKGEVPPEPQNPSQPKG